MATASFRTTLRTARAQAIITDAGATGAKVKLYNGTQPANAAASLSCMTRRICDQPSSSPTTDGQRRLLLYLLH